MINTFMEPVLRRRYARVFLEIAGEVVSGASEPTLLSSVTVSSGTSIFDGLGYTNATIIGGSSVSLSSYTGGGNPGGGGGPGGGGLPGGGGGPGGGGWH